MNTQTATPLTLTNQIRTHAKEARLTGAVLEEHLQDAHPENLQLPRHLPKSRSRIPQSLRPQKTHHHRPTPVHQNPRKLRLVQSRAPTRTHQPVPNQPRVPHHK